MMAARGVSQRRGRGTSRRRPPARLGPSSGDLVIVGQALAGLAEFLRARQASAERGQVILDRRVTPDRRSADGHDGAGAPQPERRRGERRRPAPDAAQALMRVLGFMVVPAGGARGGRTRRPTRGPAPRGAARARRAATARRPGQSRRPRTA
jgi:hypothetical protein